MQLIYLFHSGFALLGEGYTVVFDYYRDTLEQAALNDLERLVAGQKANATMHEVHGCMHDELLHRPGKFYVLSSHVHPDHFNPLVLQWREQRSDIIYILSQDILKKKKVAKEDANFLRKGESYIDELLCVEAFGSTDVGVSFLVTVAGKKIFHAGDLNNWHWMDESTEEEWKAAEKAFLLELEMLALAYPELDVAIFPVDPRQGNDYMRGAKQFVERINTKLFVPMHFTPAYEKANAFAPIAQAAGACFAQITHSGEIINLE
ncbi:MAG: MBL fold metallo-hydrolase [Phocaeicola sp.]